MRKTQLQKAMDTRLSGLRATPQMRDSVRRYMGDERGRKRKMMHKLVAAITLIALTAGGAVFANRNLQDPLYNSDPISAVVAGSTATPLPISTVSPLPISTVSPLEASTSPILNGSPSPLPSITPLPMAKDGAPVTVESTYYDGNALMIAYRIKGGYTHIEPFYPTEEELDNMKAIIEGKKASGIWLVTRYFGGMSIIGGARGTSITFSQPDTGLNVRTLFGSDHIRSSDGFEFTIQSRTMAEDGKDILVFYQLVLPLSTNMPDTQRFPLEMDFVQDKGFYWYDGTYVYSKASTESAFTISTEVVKVAPMKPKQLTGQWRGDGNVIDIHAELMPTSITLRYPIMDGMEFAPLDPETGVQPKTLSLKYLEDGTVLQVCEGAGRIPDTLYACVVTVKYSETTALNPTNEKTFNKWLRTLLEPTPE